MSNRNLSDEQVIQICQGLNNGLNQTELAERFNVDPLIIHYISKRKTYKSISDIYLKTDYKSSISSSKLSDDQVIKVCQGLNKGVRQNELAKKFNVSIDVIVAISNKRCYRKLSDIYLSSDYISPFVLSKLSDDQVIEICQELNKGVGQTELANRFNVSQAVLTNIANRRSYRHISNIYLNKEYSGSKRVLSDIQVIQICQELNKGVLQKELAERFNVSQTIISFIATRRTYKRISKVYLE